MAGGEWMHEQLQILLEQNSIAGLEKLIADPGRKYRQAFANDYALSALKNIAESDVLPDDIRVLVQRVLVLYETASDPFLGMNLQPGREGVTHDGRYGFC